MKKPIDMKESDKYDWGEGVFTLLSWFRRDLVKNAKVLVAGAGALGNEVVKCLTLFGVGHIFVVDYDKVEISNLTRSVLFREKDAYANEYKSVVVAKRAKEINPQIKVTPIVGNLFSEVGLGIYRNVDVVIGCLDSRIARYLLNRLCMRANKIWIDGSIENLTGTVRMYAPGVSCYECGLSREEFNQIMLRTGCADVVRIQASSGRIATTPISASIVGAIQVQEAMKVIHSQRGDSHNFKNLLGRILYYEGMTNTMTTYKYASWKKNCTAHEIWTHIIEGIGMSSSMTVEKALSRLKEITGSNVVEINLRNNKFVDFIVADKTDEEFRVMMPDSKLENHIYHTPELRKLSYRTKLLKSFYENIDEEFPYQTLTLNQIGIPPFDVIQVTTSNGVHYVELSDDRDIIN